MARKSPKTAVGRWIVCTRLLLSEWRAGCNRHVAEGQRGNSIVVEPQSGTAELFVARRRDLRDVGRWPLASHGRLLVGVIFSRPLHGPHRTISARPSLRFDRCGHSAPFCSGLTYGEDHTETDDVAPGVRVEAVVAVRRPAAERSAVPTPLRTTRYEPEPAPCGSVTFGFGVSQWY